jgi:hypothetical protein
MTDSKYTCEKCNYTCNYKSLWEKHISTELHKTGKRKQRSDVKSPYKCEECEYQTKNTVAFKEHKLNYHSDKETRMKEYTYYCKYCDFGSFSNKDYLKHEDTKKHKNFMNAIQ